MSDVKVGLHAVAHAEVLPGPNSRCDCPEDAETHEEECRFAGLPRQVRKPGDLQA